MGSFINLFSLKAPKKPSIKNQMVLLIGAELFSLGIVKKAFCQTLLNIIYGSRIKMGVIRIEITPNSLLNYAVGWND